MWTRPLRRLLAAGRVAAQALHRRLRAATRLAAVPLLTGTVADLARTKPALIAENAFLRQQLLVLRRQARRPRCTPADRALLVLLASRLRTWRHTLLIVQPEIVLLAPSALPVALAPEVAGPGPGAPPAPGARDDRADPGDGRRQSPVGRRAHPWRTVLFTLFVTPGCFSSS